MTKAAIKYYIKSLKKQLDHLERSIDSDDMDLAPERELSLSEVAKIIPFTEGTLRNYCNAGTIPARKIGKRWMVLESVAYDLENHMLNEKEKNNDRSKRPGITRKQSSRERARQ